MMIFCYFAKKLFEKKLGKKINVTKKKTITVANQFISFKKIITSVIITFFFLSFFLVFFFSEFVR
jgi:hypothetical protein